MKLAGILFGIFLGTCAAILLLIAIPGDIGSIGGYLVGIIFCCGGGYLGLQVFSKIFTE